MWPACRAQDESRGNNSVTEVLFDTKPVSLWTLGNKLAVGAAVATPDGGLGFAFTGWNPGVAQGSVWTDCLAAKLRCCQDDRVRS